MSWSVSLIGEPKKVVNALYEYSDKLNGISKEEYDSSLPHLVELVKQNRSKLTGIAVSIIASGHSYKGSDGEDFHQCSVKLETMYGLLT